MSQNTVEMIQMSKIHPAPFMLRPVRETSVEYLELLDSIRDKGLLNSLLVRPHPYIEGEYQVVDGSWRYFCLKELDMGEAPCIIKVGVDDEDVLALQITANAVSYETRPVEFAEQMARMIRIREEAGLRTTAKELADTLNKSASWVSRRLKILELPEEAKQALKDEEISLGHAVVLTRVWHPAHQLRFLESAKETKVRDFELEVGRWIASKRSEKMGERRAQREPNLRPRLRSMDSMLIELDTLEEISQIIVQKALTTPLQGAKAMLEWILNLDDAGRENQLREARFQLSHDERREILGRQRYEELKALREEREKRSKKRVSFSQQDSGETE